MPSEIHEEVAEVSQRTTAAAPATPAYTQAQVSPADEMAMLQNRLNRWVYLRNSGGVYVTLTLFLLDLKSLKTTRMSLEMELKDNKEKLRRLEGRMKKEDKNEVIART